jgi:uncharacterized membrane protein YkoI
MNKLFPPALALSAVLGLGAITSPALASDHKKSDHEAARAALARGEILPLPRILTIATGKVPGDVLEVELEDEHGRLIYDLKILARNGRVREVEIDAKTGAVLKVEDD